MKSIDGIMGFIVGDAMGVPVEFVDRSKLVNNPVTQMVGGGSHNMPKGTWSDDSSMTLATIDAINTTGSINLNKIADNFIAWLKEAKYTPANKMFDIGRTTLQALAKYESGAIEPENTGGTGEYDNGNGSLMRILPIAYYSYYKKLNNNEILDIVRKVSSITHRHEISVIGCYIYVMFTIELLKGNDFNVAYNNVRVLDYSEFSIDNVARYSRILEDNIQYSKIDDIRSDGYVVSTLEAVLWVLFNTTSYNQAIIGAINLGNDTDTIAACAGGLAGIRYGVDSINKEWYKSILKKEYIEKLCDDFDNVLNNS